MVYANALGELYLLNLETVTFSSFVLNWSKPIVSKTVQYVFLTLYIGKKKKVTRIRRQLVCQCFC